MKKLVGLLVCIGLVNFCLAQAVFRKGPNQLVFNHDSTFSSDFKFSQKQKLSFSPLFNLAGGLEKTATASHIINSTLVGTVANYNAKKWSLEAYLQAGNYILPSYVNFRVANKNTIPGWGKAYDGLGPNAWGNIFFGGFAQYKASQFFTFTAGYDKQFIGEGYRSLLLSDNASNAPFLNISTQYWRVKYSNLFMALSNRFAPGEEGFKSNKYTASHVLEFQATKWLKLSLFETVIWQAKDSLYNRGFDINYLNPVIFYRPVEFSQGSADNAMVGGGISIKPIKQLTLYSQFLLDEFLLREIRAQRGWWANKFAIQTGAKYFDAFNIKGLSLLGELNLARPFTYSHVSKLSSYSHYNQPLAHPLGANFYEALALVQYRSARHQFNLETVLIKQGTSTDNNFGEDPLRSYRQRAMEYGNTIGQGLANNVFFAQFDYAYTLIKKYPLQTYTSISFRKSEQGQAVFGSIGVRTSLFNSYRDY